MSTARFALLCTLIVVLGFVVSALGVGMVVIAVFAGLLTLLREHRRLFFRGPQREAFIYASYLVALVIMIWTTVAVALRVQRMMGGTLIPWEIPLPNPLRSGYALHFTLGALFLLWAWRPANPNAVPMGFTGAVLADQGHLLREVPRVVLESLRRSLHTVLHEHWLKGIGGLVLLVLAIPVGVVAFAAGAAAVIWFAVVWGGLCFLAVIPLWVVFRVFHRKGRVTVCPGCGQVHGNLGPGPLGLVHLRCRCGQKISLWKRPEAVLIAYEVHEVRSWWDRPAQSGTLPLLVVGVVVSLLSAWNYLRG